MTKEGCGGGALPRERGLVPGCDESWPADRVARAGGGEGGGEDAARWCPSSFTARSPPPATQPQWTTLSNPTQHKGNSSVCVCVCVCLRLFNASACVCVPLCAYMRAVDAHIYLYTHMYHKHTHTHSSQQTNLAPTHSQADFDQISTERKPCTPLPMRLASVLHEYRSQAWAPG